MGKLIGVWLAFAILFFAGPSMARGRIVVPRGAPLELRPAVGNYEASFDVKNDSDDPLWISRIAPRTDADDVRLPRRVTARFESGQTSGTIPPHGTARVRVTWAPDRDTHVRSFYGHVMITSTDESAGEVAVGIAAHDKRLGPLGKHLLSTAVLLPLLGAALLALFLVASGGGRGRQPRVVALVMSLACAAVALAACAAFDPELLRAEGGDGFQLVERAAFARSLGVEMFLGVDGVSLPLFVVCAIAAPCGVLAAWEQRQSPAVFFALYMLLVGASLGAIVALDGVLFVFCLALALAAAFLLVGLFGRGDARAAAGRMLVLGGAGLALVALALGALHGASTRTFLVDGSPMPHAWALPELARVDFFASKATLLGGSLAKSAFVLSFVGLALLGAVFPFHAWLASALRSAPPAVGAMIAVGLTRAALVGVLRLDVAVLPESLRWAASAVGALGAAGALYAAFVAVGERNFVSIASFAAVSVSGVALVGLASLSPQAMLGSVSALATSGAALAAAVLALGALRDRTGTLEARDLRGLGIEAPLLACAAAVAALACGAVPGTAGFWTTWLVGLGAVVREPGLAFAVLAGAIVLAASQAIPLVSLLRGRLPDALRRSEALAPHGGRIPDLRPREIAALAPLLLLLLVLGFWPSPLLGRAANTVRDTNDLVSPTHVE
ncbi:MAG TPA: proton-conducting transporter membrane subunit [Polyangiaceae bacterium]|jgi:NADH-quinone oxidoreductase subunit M